MRERPILFAAPMVRAILGGKKTVARWLVNPQPGPPPSGQLRHEPRHSAPYFDSYCSEMKTDANPRGMSNRWCWWTADDRPDPLSEIRCPYGAPGDRLWVRETWQAWNCVSPESDEWDPITREVRHGESWAEWVELRGKPDTIEYRADGKSCGPWTPSIHMPRWASRIDLEVVSVRVERLHAIDGDDVVREGIDPTPHRCHCEACGMTSTLCTATQSSLVDEFAGLWRSINGADSWRANPYVWRVEFKRVDGAA